MSNYVKPTIRTVAIVWAVLVFAFVLFFMAHDSLHHESLGHNVFPTFAIITGIMTVVALVAGLIAWDAQSQ